ncbi:MAG: hypothetical protein OHK0026_05240 [Rhodocyclaceae bacterium]
MSEMSMLLQQAFQQAMPLWQRNWIRLPPSSIAGTTGLAGSESSGVWALIVAFENKPGAPRGTPGESYNSPALSARPP